MNPINVGEVCKFFQEHIGYFHGNRLQHLAETKLEDLLEEPNFYLFKAKQVIVTVYDLIAEFLDARLSSFEEKLLGDILRDLALFVVKRTLNAIRSASTGIDFEYAKDKKRYLVSVKSGLNWGNSSQWQALENNFKNASSILRQSPHVDSVDCILGICYGRAKTTIRRGIITQVCGQNFWYMISGDESFYTKIIEPLGCKAREKNESFDIRKGELINKLTKQFIDEFCDENGKILWEELVRFNSQNLTEEDKQRFGMNV